MIIQYPASQEKLGAGAYKSAMKEMTRGEAKELQPIIQGHPYDTTYGNMVAGCYSTTNSSNGFYSCMSPITYVTAYNTGSTHQMWVQVLEATAGAGQQLTDSGDGLTWNFPYANIVEEDGGSKDPLIYVNGTLKTKTTDYSLDYPAGTCTFVADQSGNVVTWTGYWLDHSVGYMKAITDAIRQYDLDDATFNVLPVQNFRFDHWTSSTQPTKWTKAGTVGRTAAAFKYLSSGTAYDATLTATAGWTSLKQTVTIPSAMTQVIALAVAKTTYSMSLRVSMDSEATWSTVNLTPSSQGQSKWTLIAVASSVNSTTTPVIEFRPQVASGDTSIATLAYLGMISGGLL